MKLEGGPPLRSLVARSWNIEIFWEVEGHSLCHRNKMLRRGARPFYDACSPLPVGPPHQVQIFRWRRTETSMWGKRNSLRFWIVSLKKLKPSIRWRKQKHRSGYWFLDNNYMKCATADLRRLPLLRKLRNAFVESRSVYMLRKDIRLGKRLSKLSKTDHFHQVFGGSNLSSTPLELAAISLAKIPGHWSIWVPHLGLFPGNFLNNATIHGETSHAVQPTMMTYRIVLPKESWSLRSRNTIED